MKGSNKPLYAINFGFKGGSTSLYGDSRDRLAQEAVLNPSSPRPSPSTLMLTSS